MKKGTISELFFSVHSFKFHSGEILSADCHMTDYEPQWRKYRTAENFENWNALFNDENALTCLLFSKLKTVLIWMYNTNFRLLWLRDCNVCYSNIKWHFERLNDFKHLAFALCCIDSNWKSYFKLTFRKFNVIFCIFLITNYNTKFRKLVSFHFLKRWTSYDS